MNLRTHTTPAARLAPLYQRVSTLSEPNLSAHLSSIRALRHTRHTPYDFARAALRQELAEAVTAVKAAQRTNSLLFLNWVDIVWTLDKARASQIESVVTALMAVPFVRDRVQECPVCHQGFVDTDLHDVCHFCRNHKRT